MKVIGLTGGIGSGKTTVAKMFKELGVPIYIADDEAKALMNRSKVIKRKLTALFGKEAYKNDTLNRTYLSKKIFKNKDLLSKMNAIVHPKVAQHFNRWLKKQDSKYVIKEAAIIFELNKAKEYSKVILVVANMEQRIQRILSRDGMTREKAISIMDNQLSDKIKIGQADFIIQNDDLSNTKNQVVKIHQEILQLVKEN